MHDASRPWILPHLAIVILLFGACVMAPRAWRSMTVEPIDPAVAIPEAAVESPAEATDKVSAAADRVVDPHQVVASAEASIDQPLVGRVAKVLPVLSPAPQVAILNGPIAGNANGHRASPDRLPIDSLRTATRPAAPQLRRPATERAMPTETLETTAASTVERSPQQPQRKSIWPLPVDLLQRLERLADTAAAPWANEVAASAQRLSDLDQLSGEAARTEIDSLRRQVRDGLSLAETLAGQTGVETRLAAFALQRRLEIWSALQQITTHPTATTHVGLATPETCLDEMHDRLTGSPNASGWYHFLQLGRFSELLTDAHALDRRELAQKVLHRIDSPLLTAHQRRFLSEDVFVDYAELLRNWSREPISYPTLLADLEQFETAGDHDHARRLADYWQIVRWSDDQQVKRLGQRLNMHYRNANIRVAISSQLLNRLLPPVPTVNENVRDVIVGADVQGRTRTRTLLRVVLEPDERRWRFGLTARGRVDSDTYASKGPVTLHQQAVARFDAVKPLAVDAQGIRAGRTRARADNRTTRTDVRTQFDAIPIVGTLLQSIARQQQDKSEPEVQRRVRNKVARTAQQRIDDEVEKKVDELTERFNSKLLAPMRRLQLDPTTVEMQTTQERLIVRYRLAGARQLAAHTPRPQAPVNSWLSLQVHESALNNTLDQFDLGAEQQELSKLIEELAAKLDMGPVVLPEDFPRDVTVLFDADEAVRVRMDEGRIQISLRISKLSVPGRTWRDLYVRAYYQPVPPCLEQPGAQLQRDGYVQLSGRRLKLRDQIALRGIFSKVLPRHSQLNILSEQALQRPELRDAQVTQFELRDGWVGLALGPRPKTAAARPR